MPKTYYLSFQYYFHPHITIREISQFPIFSHFLSLSRHLYLIFLGVLKFLYLCLRLFESGAFKLSQISLIQTLNLLNPKKEGQR